MLSRFFLVLVAAFGVGWGSPAKTEPAVPGDTVERIVLKSRVMGEERPIVVRLPPGYKGTQERYPVLYLTDGDGHWQHTAASIAYLKGLSQAPEMIVVGISNTDRTRDLTPTAQARAEAGKPVGGGADRFLRFIETELMPEVERKYRTQPFRIFAGHSLGGLFAIHTLVSRPELFQAYLAVSPALSWGDQVVLKRAAEQLKTRREWKRTLFLALGNEQGGMRAAFERLVALLGEHRPNGLQWSVYRADDQDHASVVPGSHFVGLRRLYSGWSAKVDPMTGLVAGGLGGLEAHYRGLAERFGYAVPIPEELLNDQGYRRVARGELEEAVALFRAGVERYPTSANAHDSLGDAYERQGKLELARTQYAEAVALGKKSDDPDTAKFRANLERVIGKMQ